jgi:hypothetical protein
MFIPDPVSEFFSSRIHIKKFKYLNSKKMFLSSRKYDPGCSSRILIFIHPGSRIQGSNRAPDPGYGSATVVVRKLEDLGGILRQASDEEFSVVLIACCGRLLDLCTIHSLRHFPSEIPLQLIVLFRGCVSTTF